MSDPLEAINQQTTVVTVSRRLSRYLREQHGRSQQLGETASQAWQTPDILPWSSWVEREFQRLRGNTGDGGNDARVLLRPHQEQKIWQKIIEDEIADPSDHVYQVPATARAVSEARRVAQEWQIDLRELAKHSAPDAARLHVWNQRFEQYLEAHELISGADALAELTALIARGNALPIEKLIFAGFSELTPRQRVLMETVAGTGVAVVEYQAQPHADDASRFEFDAAEQQLEAIAGWAHATLVAEPQASIAVVCPQLDGLGQAVARTLSDTLEGHHFESGLVHLSLGQPLQQTPLVRAAFAAFTLLDYQIDVDELGLVLNSPFFAGADSEICQRAQLDVSLRSRRRKSISFHTLRYLLGDHETMSTIAPGFSKLIEDFAALRSDFRSDGQALRATEWAQSIHAFLRQLGWPGERPLNVEEQQTQQAFNDLLTDLCALDLVQQPMSLAAVVSELRHLAADRMHQPQARPAPIQVMSINDSSGLQFSHLWVAGMSEDVWPPPARPLSFLPVPLQRQAGLSQASAERVFGAAELTIQRLRCAAPEVIFSHVRLHDDVETRPSPLIADIDSQPAPAQSARLLQRRRVFDSLDVTELEAYTDDTAPVPAPGIAGGTSFFSDQAKCPFRAFARHRLAARAPESLGSGLDPLERGQLVHDAMEELWRNHVSSQAQLRALDDERLQRLLDEVVNKALNKDQRKFEQLMSPVMEGLERQRLKTLIGRWLQIEKEREDNFVVASVESDATHEIAGLKLKLRSDRIDRTDDDRYVIIDYKTGKPSLGDWRSDRPTELQLPIYARVLDFESVDAIAYARIRVGEEAFVGLSRDTRGRKGLQEVGKGKRNFENWQDLSEHLNASIDTIAAEIREGHAGVEPLAGVCERCDLTALCRVSRWSNGLADEDVGVEGDSETDLQSS